MRSITCGPRWVARSTSVPSQRSFPDTLYAYNLYLQARFYVAKVSGSGFAKALECFTQALALEPAYVQVQAGIAMTQALRSVLSFGHPLQLMPPAKEAALKALAVDDRVADAPAALAFVQHFYEWDWTGAEREYRRALDLNPGDTFVRAVYSGLLGQQGRADASRAGRGDAHDF